MRAESGVISELEIVRSEDSEGKLRPEAVVQFASNPRTALHSRFEWDDTEAGKAYRIWQARQIISIAVRVIHEDKPAYRAYVSLSSDRQTGGGYRSLDVVMRNPTMYAEMLDDALEELKRLKQKYGRLQELELVWRAAKRVESQRQRQRKRKAA